MSNSSSSGGIGLFSATFLVFLILKLTHVIDWSWWWIIAPLWGSLGLLIFILIIMFIIAFVVDK